MGVVGLFWPCECPNSDGMASFGPAAGQATQTGPDEGQFETDAWIYSKLYGQKWPKIAKNGVFPAFWLFGAPKWDLCELVPKYQSCPCIRRSIWHPVWRTRVGGWRVWRVAPSRGALAPNANRPFLRAKSSIFFSGLLARIFILLGR